MSGHHPGLGLKFPKGIQKVQGLGGCGLGFQVWGLGFSGFGFRLRGSRFRLLGLGIAVTASLNPKTYSFHCRLTILRHSSLYPK